MMHHEKCKVWGEGGGGLGLSRKACYFFSQPSRVYEIFFFQPSKPACTIFFFPKMAKPFYPCRMFFLIHFPCKIFSLFLVLVLESLPPHPPLHISNGASLIKYLFTLWLYRTDFQSLCYSLVNLHQIPLKKNIYPLSKAMKTVNDLNIEQSSVVFDINNLFD